MDIGPRLSASALALILLAGAPALPYVGPAWAQGASSEGDDSQAPEASSAAPGRPVGGVVDPLLNPDGIYRGGAEFVSGNSYSCRGMTYTLEVAGRRVRAELTPPAGSRASGGSFSAPLQSDGTVTSSYVAVGGSGRVDVQLALNGDLFTGYSQSQTCRYRIFAKRS